jgi:outer membrane lipoprotein carrier protein
MRVAFTLLLLAVLPATASAKKAPRKPALSPAEKLVARVQKHYSAIKKMELDFQQEYERQLTGKKTVSTGKLYTAKPDKMRWDYAKPDPAHYISDGTTLWVYEPTKKKAYKQSLAGTDLPTALTFLHGAPLTNDFAVALDPGAYGAKGDEVLKLTPKQPSARYKNIWLVVDASNQDVKESVILEATGNTNHFTFTNPAIDGAANVEDKHFVFTPPKDVKVITP